MFYISKLSYHVKKIHFSTFSGNFKQFKVVTASQIAAISHFSTDSEHFDQFKVITKILTKAKLLVDLTSQLSVKARTFLIWKLKFG